MREIKTVGEAWQVLKEHGLGGKYCPHCDQFAQARVLLKQDEKISDLYEALKVLTNLSYMTAKEEGMILVPRGEAYIIAQARADEALAKAEGK